MADKMGALLITGLLAVLGTVAGGVVKGYWDTNLAEMNFQSKLILRALEPDDAAQRIAALQFLVNANLITDPKVRQGLDNILNEGVASIPQFQAVGASTQIRADTISSREKVLEKFPELRGKNVALTGFRVRHGDIIDALTPVYAEVTDSLQLQGEFEGAQIGGGGGEETRLVQPGYVVTGVDVQSGAYFGRTVVVHMQVIWTRLTATGIDPDSTIVSAKLGDGEHARLLGPPKEIRANQGAFISDFASTSGMYVNDIQIAETVVIKR